MTRPALPPVGSTVHPAGRDDMPYRVIAHVADLGVRVEAAFTEVVDVPGRRARPVHYSEKRATLAMTDRGLIDDRWCGWTVRS